MGKRHGIWQPLRATLSALILSLLVGGSRMEASAARPWTVKDTIEMSKLSIFPRSQDQRYLPIVTSRGLLESNKLESKLWLFDTINADSFIRSDASQYAPAGKLLVTMAAKPISTIDSELSVIGTVRWSPDAKRLYFLARCGKNSEHVLFCVDLKTLQTTQLSNEEHDVTAFDVAGDICAYTSPVQPLKSPESFYQSAGSALPDIELVGGKAILDLLYPNRPKFNFESGPQNLWIVKDGKVTCAADVENKAPLSFTSTEHRLSVSPDGKHVIMLQRMTEVPSLWTQYTPNYERGFDKFVSGKYGEDGIKSGFIPERYLLLELASGKTSVLSDAPMGKQSGWYDWAAMRWSQDSHSIALSAVYYPLNITGDNPHLRPCAFIINLPSKSIEFVSERPIDTESNLQELQWVGDNVLRLKYYKQPFEYYQRVGENWKRSDETVAKGFADKKVISGIEFEPFESFNQQPVLKVLDTSTHQSKVFFDPNPQLAQIEMGNARIFKWKDKTGREIEGGLITPSNYQPGKKFPLVLQSYGFDDKEFFADSRYKSAYPGRSLAGRGMFVLQMNDARGVDSDNAKGPVEARDAYLSAIEQLSRDGLVDPSRVGIVAFSHSGFYVNSMLTHEPKAIRAAVMAECSDLTYTEYLNAVDWATPHFVEGLADKIGSKPFGKGLENWMKESPGFNTDKIEAATLFQFFHPTTLAWSWSMYPAMRTQGKPVELLFIRNGTHELVEPKQRFASQETSLDWFDFFLNNHEDPIPQKADQYARWRKLPKPN